jgi:hypothetical protein
LWEIAPVNAWTQAPGMKVLIAVVPVVSLTLAMAVVYSL